MLSRDSRLRPNVKEVAAKVMDGEAIMIHFANGTYYSMDKVGGAIWGLIEGSHSAEEIADVITAQYDVSLDRAQIDVERLVAELLQEGLIEISEDGPPRPETSLEESGQKETYESPNLNAYRDMAALLALDPPMPGVLDSPWKEPEA